MDLVKWLQKQKKQRLRDHSGDIDTDDNDIDSDIANKGRQYRSRSVDPTSATFLTAQNVNKNLAHHHSGMKERTTVVQGGLT